MPVFPHAANTTINGGYFTDIQGDQYLLQGDRFLSEVESGILALQDASALGATHDSLERHPPPKCQPGTRKTTLKRIDDWVQDMEMKCRLPFPESSNQTTSTAQTSASKIRTHERILWLHGPAGAGKSALAQTVADTYAGSGILVGSFFFSRGAPGRDTARHLFPTVAYQIAMRIPALRSAIGSAVKSDRSIFEKSFDAQINQLIVVPVQSLEPSPPSEPTRAPFLCILDGLDECGTKDVQSDILRHVADLLYKYDLPLCFLIVSRPESHIKGVLRSDTFRSYRIAEELSLYAENNSTEANLDIRAFLLAEFKRIRRSTKHREFMKFVSTPWPSRDIIDLLVVRSGGYFIYVATVIRFVDEEFCHPVERLQLVLDASSRDGSPFAELDKLYCHILSTNPNRNLLLRILGYIFCIPSPPIEVAPIDIHRTDVVEGVLGLQLGTVRSMLGGLHSLIRVEDRPKSFHASFLDFLIDKSRAEDFFIDVPKHHNELALNLLSIAGRWQTETTRIYERWFFLSWSFHACNASDPSIILHKLEGIDVEQWKVIVDSWQAPLPIISTLTKAISWLEPLGDPARGQIFRMNTVLNYTDQKRPRDSSMNKKLSQTSRTYRC